MFSVKMAYDFLLQENVTGRDFWNNVWKWEGPQKIRCFLWLVINDGLKTNDKRSRCQLTNQSNCPLCLTENENSFHLLRDCELVKPVWRHFGFDFDRGERDNVRNWLGKHLNATNQNRHVMFGIISWCIWVHRNQHVFEDKIFEWQNVTVHISYLLDEITRAANVFPHMERTYTSIHVGWKFPRKGWIKCNTDGH
jgi:hypothetical protein